MSSSVCSVLRRVMVWWLSCTLTMQKTTCHSTPLSPVQTPHICAREQTRTVYSQCLWPGGISVKTVCRYGRQSLRGPPPHWVCGSCHNASPGEREGKSANQTTAMRMAKELPVFTQVSTAPSTPVRLLPFYTMQAPVEASLLIIFLLKWVSFVWTLDTSCPETQQS